MAVKNRLLVLLFTVFVFQISEAQTIVLDENDSIENADCAAKIKKAKEMYAEVFKSESSVAYRKIKNDFYSKLYKGTDLNNAEGATCIERTLNWIENSIEQTAFQNFEEAKNIWQKKTEARELFEKESAELHKYLKELNKTCPKQDCQQLYLDLMEEYGNEFFL
ncbi:hypothetical protein [Flavobacterium suaedae]|nr:hypothetical protein [Flavobacterium suaedae]